MQLSAKSLCKRDKELTNAAMGKIRSKLKQDIRDKPENLLDSAKKSTLEQEVDREIDRYTNSAVMNDDVMAKIKGSTNQGSCESSGGSWKGGSCLPNSPKRSRMSCDRSEGSSCSWQGKNQGQCCQMAVARFLDSTHLALLASKTLAPLRYVAKFDPFLSLDCAPTPL